MGTMEKGAGLGVGGCLAIADPHGLKPPRTLSAARVLAVTVSAHTVPAPGSHQSMCHFSFSQKFFSLVLGFGFMLEAMDSVTAATVTFAKDQV